MKTRTDSTPLLEKVSKVTKVEKREPTENRTVLFEFEDEVDDSSNIEHYTTEIEYAEYDADASEPPTKQQKTHHKEEVRTIVEEYTLVGEDGSEIVKAPKLKQPTQFVEFHASEAKELTKNKRRSKAFGKYITALMIDINDDKTFFELQSKITSVIQEATVKQSKT